MYLLTFSALQEINVNMFQLPDNCLPMVPLGCRSSKLDDDMVLCFISVTFYIADKHQDMAWNVM